MTGSGEWPPMRRADRAMGARDAMRLLDRGFCARLGTVGPDGWPYVVPLLYAIVDGEAVFHHVRDQGHLNRNLRHSPRACLEVDEPGEVFALGPSAAQTAVAYASVVAFGTVREVTDPAAKARILDALVARYAAHLPGPRPLPAGAVTAVAVYAMSLDRVTGKRHSRPDPPARSDT